jgi:hypothetical protein
MKLFRCQNCGQVLYFENVRCERCGHALGYMPRHGVLSALEPADDAFRPLAAPRTRRRYCANAAYGVCNWLVPVDEPAEYCAACRHNRTIPPLDVPENVTLWRMLETAKHRLIYQLMRLGMPLQTQAEDAEHGLAFDFLADPPEQQGPKVLTGHDNGLITIALVEADDAERERRRQLMHEPFRTLLGHFRHEVGHHYWDLLIRGEGRLDACRAVFGDDQQDYEQALQAHYDNGPPPGWQQSYVSAYATSHPWEDWAETWAHYLHIIDALDTAGAYGLRTDPKVSRDRSLRGKVDFDPYAAGSVDALVDSWLPLSYAINSINRSMGLADIYPFVLSQDVIRKLGFIHEVVHAARTPIAAAAPPPAQSVPPPSAPPQPESAPAAA